MSNIKRELTWIEIDSKSLISNLSILRAKIGKKRILAPCVKGNAYGHGLVEAAKIFAKGGADWLCVNALWEAEILRKAGIDIPLYVMGYVPISELEAAVGMGVKLVVYDKQHLDAIQLAAKKQRKIVAVHLKVETGTNRQGLTVNQLIELAKHAKKLSNINVEGMATHFANIEDVDPAQALKMTRKPTRHSYAYFQLSEFERCSRELEKAGIYIPIRHCSNSGAVLLFPKTYFEMVRPGISAYGMWPSHEVEEISDAKLKPALTWYTRVGQIKKIPKDSYIGYGCTFKTTRPTTIAVLPTGYYDGYDRGLSNKGYVVVNGRKAPIRGRIFMNMTVIDITGIPGVKQEDPVILLGGKGKNSITVDEMAANAGTINYEITTRIRESIPRLVV